MTDKGTAMRIVWERDAMQRLRLAAGAITAEIGRDVYRATRGFDSTPGYDLWVRPRPRSRPNARVYASGRAARSNASRQVLIKALLRNVGRRG